MVMTISTGVVSAPIGHLTAFAEQYMDATTLKLSLDMNSSEMPDQIAFIIQVPFIQYEFVAHVIVHGHIVTWNKHYKGSPCKGIIRYVTH